MKSRRIRYQGGEAGVRAPALGSAAGECASTTPVPATRYRGQMNRRLEIEVVA